MVSGRFSIVGLRISPQCCWAPEDQVFKSPSLTALTSLIVIDAPSGLRMAIRIYDPASDGQTGPISLRTRGMPFERLHREGLGTSRR